MLINGRKRINGVTQALGHLVAVLVEHQAVGNDIFERDRIGDHRGYGVKREEPPSCLVYAFGDEVGREHLTKIFTVFKRVVRLRVGHRSRVEPYVYQVGLATHGATGGAYQHDLINIRPVQIEQRVVLRGEIALHEILQRVAGHITGIDAARYLHLQLRQRSDAHLLLAVVGHPDGQRRAPVA